MPSISADVPGRYAGASLDTFDPTVSTAAAQAHAAARAFVDAHRAEMLAFDVDPGDVTPANVVLVGPPGVGKTHLAAATFWAMTEAKREAGVAAMSRYSEAERAHQEAVKAWAEESQRLWESTAGDADARARAGAAIDEGNRIYSRAPRPSRPRVDPVWVNVPGALVDMRREFGREDRPITEWIDELRRLRALVVLDDLGREKASDWTAEVLYVLVNDRYEDRLPTFVTTNLSRDELVSSGYWPVISRLAEDGRLVEVKAPDHRLGKR